MTLLEDLRALSAEHRAKSNRAYEAAKYDGPEFMLFKGYADAFQMAADLLEAELPRIEADGFYRAVTELDPTDPFAAPTAGAA